MIIKDLKGYIIVLFSFVFYLIVYYLYFFIY